MSERTNKRKMSLPATGRIGWQLKCLRDHVKFLKTASNSRADLSEEASLAYLHYGDIHTTKQVKLDARKEYVPNIDPERVRGADRLKKGDLIFVDASEDIDGVGKSVEVAEVPEEGMVAGLHTIAARFDKTVLADGFKAYLQFCPAFSGTLKQLAAGTKVLATNLRHIASAEVPLPPLSEQRAIATALSDVDALIDALDRLIAKKRDIKQATMQQLLTGETRLPGFEGEWETKRLGEVVSRIIGGGTPSRYNSAYWGNGIHWVTVLVPSEAGHE